MTPNPSLPAAPVEAVVPSDWRIDTSTGRDILLYKDCSVIEGETAHYVMQLIAGAPPAVLVEPAGLKLVAYIDPRALDVLKNFNVNEDLYRQSTERATLALYAATQPADHQGEQG